MIHLQSLQHIIIALLLVFLLLPGQVIGAVLCIGADGHIVVEAAQNNRCDTFSKAASAPLQAQITNTVPRPNHCGPCVDVPLLTSDSDDQAFLSAPSTFPKLEAPVLVLGAFAMAVSLESPDIPFISQPSPLAHSLLAHRIVVLLL